MALVTLAKEKAKASRADCFGCFVFLSETCPKYTDAGTYK